MWASVVVLALVLGACRQGGDSQDPEGESTSLTIAAASSLRHVMPALVAAYEARHPGVRVALTYGASGDLRRQVEGGAPIDAVVFASAGPVDSLVRAGLVAPGSRKVVATNQLVLVGPPGGPRLTFRTLGTLGPRELLAVGDPGAVPAGQYARDSLKELGLWESLRGRMVLGGDVAAVLAYARRGEVAAAIVYRTEVRGLSDVVLLDEARGEWAPRPEVVAGAAREGRAADFVAFLGAPGALALWQEHGFGPP